MQSKVHRIAPSGALTRRTACAGLGALALAGSYRHAAALDWPHRPVTVIVPYAAGGNTDMMARLAAQYLSEKLGQSFIIENRAGGGGSIGAIGAARAAPDGYTLMFGASTQIINIPLMQKVAYDPNKDFTPISIFGTGPYLLGIKASLPVNNLAEFIAYVKANPGKLNYATAGQGGNVHLNTALFIAKVGLDMVAIPYKSGAPAVAGLASGEVDMYFGNASEVVQFEDNPLVKILAVSTKQRLAQLPNVPTVAETYPGFDTSSWNGFFAPSGTPQAIIDLIAKHVIAAAKEPTIMERLNRLTIIPFGTTQAEFQAIIEKARVSVRESMIAAKIPIIN
jgi:tripartite-type tricarboxylate transporter receptor subunit TctC